MMQRMFRGSVVMTLALLLGLGCLMASAQQNRGNRGGANWQNMTAEERQARMDEMQTQREEQMREQLDADDNEWKVIQPLLRDVQTKQRATMAGMFGGGRGGRGGGPGGPGGGAGRGGVENPERDALRTALESDSTETAEIKAKLKAFRDAREKREKELADSRKKLQEVLSVRQEAELVMMGVLE